ncbi:MAG: hypothetical protein HQK76_01920 [Desulfobacterales bacterium]|nr:hypothetical protein [Desulfobacterales bacterium]
MYVVRNPKDCTVSLYYIILFHAK